MNNSKPSCGQGFLDFPIIEHVIKSTKEITTEISIDQRGKDLVY